MKKFEDEIIAKVMACILAGEKPIDVAIGLTNALANVTSTFNSPKLERELKVLFDIQCTQYKKFQQNKALRKKAANDHS